MYGLLIEAIMECTKKNFGNDVWEKARKKAKVNSYSFSAHQQYSETLFVKLCKCVGEVVDRDGNEIMELVGREFIFFVSQYGYDRMIRVLGRHMRDFVNGIDNLHEYMRFSYEKMRPPSFFVEKETGTGLILHYRSRRKGLLHYFIGQIKQVGITFYKLECEVSVISDVIEGEIYHTTMRLDFKNNQYDQAVSSANMSQSSRTNKSISCDLEVRSEIFFELFPFHLIFKKNLEIISVGDGLSLVMKNIEGELIKDLFNINRPMISLTYDNIIHHLNNIFELVTIEPVRRSKSPVGESDRESSIYGTHSSVASEFEECCLKLKGQMMFVKEWDSVIFLAIPVLENLDTMHNIGFFINDLSMHDSSRDLVLIGNQQSSEIKLALDQEKQRSKALEESMKKLDQEIKKTDQLLYQMIPKKIADRLRNGEAVVNICEVYPICTILFSDVVGFTSTCSQLAPMQVVTMLNDMYTKFDKCLESHSVYKVETIGDAYMVVSGLPEKTNNHSVEIIEMAFDMLNAISTLLNPVTMEPMKIRVGCHSGPVVAGVVGLKMPRYCLFGDAVNTASRMESTSQPMRIHISHATKVFLDKKKYKVVERGSLEIKGKGDMKTYFVTNKVDEDGKSIECQYMEVYEDFNNKEIAAGRKIQQVHSTLESTNRNLGMGFRAIGVEDEINEDSNDDEDIKKNKKTRKELLQNSNQISKNNFEIMNSNELLNNINTNPKTSKGEENEQAEPNEEKVGQTNNNSLTETKKLTSSKSVPKLKSVTQKHLIDPNKSTSKVNSTTKNAKVTFSNQTIVIPKDKLSTTCHII